MITSDHGDGDGQYCFAQNQHRMRVLKTIEYWFDFIVGYLMTHPRKKRRYHRYMYTKWGTRYCSKEDFDEYWRKH